MRQEFNKPPMPRGVPSPRQALLRNSFAMLIKNALGATLADAEDKGGKLLGLYCWNEAVEK